MRQNHRQIHNRVQARQRTRLWVVALMTASVILGGLVPGAQAQLTPGDILVIDPDAGTDGFGALFRADPATGTRTLLSDFGDPAQGPTGRDPRGVALEAAGTILVSDFQAGTDGFGALFRADPATGTRTLLSDFGNDAQGSTGRNPFGVAVEAGGTILVSDQNAGTSSAGALFRVDPATGTRTLLSDFGNGAQGPLGSQSLGVAVVESDTQPAHDLAVSAITAPKTVTLTTKKPVQSKEIKVEIQNRSPHPERIEDLTGLVSLTVDPLGPGSCSDPLPVLHQGPRKSPCP